MDNSRIEAALDDAIEAFRGAPETPEDGLAVDAPALLQLRRRHRRAVSWRRRSFWRPKTGTTRW